AHRGRATLDRRAVMSLSPHTTSSPCRKNRSHRCDPTNPAPPVITVRTAALLRVENPAPSAYLSINSRSPRGRFSALDECRDGGPDASPFPAHLHGSAPPAGPAAGAAAAGLEDVVVLEPRGDLAVPPHRPRPVRGAGAEPGQDAGDHRPGPAGTALPRRRLSGPPRPRQERLRQLHVGDDVVRRDLR